MYMRTYRPIVVTLFFLFCCLPIAQTQDVTPLPVNPSLTGCQATELTLLNDLNTYRVSQNIVPLVTNPILCQIAYDQAVHRSSLSLNDFLRTPHELRLDQNGKPATNVIQWAKDKNFTPYPNGIPNVRLAYFVSERVGPAEASGILQAQWRDLLRDSQFREAGLSYIRNASTGYHMYFLVVGSRPNVLPALAVESNGLPIEANTPLYADQLHIAITNESFNSDSSSEYLRQVVAVNISETAPRKDRGEVITVPPTLMSCTLGLEERQPYSLLLSPSVSPSVGLKTFYIRLCDKSDRMIITQIDVSILGTTSGPTLIPTIDAIAAVEGTFAVETAAALDETAAAATLTAQQSSIETIVAETKVAIALAQQTTLTAEAMQTQVAQVNLSLTPPTPLPTLSPTATETPTASPTIPPTATETPTIPPTLTETPNLPPTATETPTSLPTSTETPTHQPTATETPTSTTTDLPTQSPSKTCTANCVKVTPFPLPVTATMITPIAIGTPSTPYPDVENPWLELVWDEDRMIIKNVHSRPFNPETVSFLSTDGEKKYLDLGEEKYTFKPIATDSCIQVYHDGNDSSISSFFLQHRDVSCTNEDKLASTGVALLMNLPWTQDFVVRFMDTDNLEDFICRAEEGRCVVPYPGSN